MSQLSARSGHPRVDRRMSMIRTRRANARAARRSRADDPRGVRVTRAMLHSSSVRVLFLGTGTSHGVPMIGCDCDVCRSTDPRDSRTRPSIVIDCDDGMRVLVDTTPDLRSQALRHDLRRVDAILFTHSHADHVMGLDEVRRYNWLSRTPMPVYGDAPTLREVRRAFACIFESDAPRGGGCRMFTCSDPGPFCLGRQVIQPVPIRHGPWNILGFGSAVCVSRTAMNSRDIARAPAGLDCRARRAAEAAASTHFTIDQAVEMARQVGARQTLFRTRARAWPRGVRIASDNMAGLRWPVRSGRVNAGHLFS